MKNYYVSDLAADIGNLTTVSSSNFVFEDYSIKEIEGKRFVIGERPIKNPHRDPTLYKGPELLFSLIQLVKGELPAYFNGPHMDRVISDKDVLNWCEKYGIPYRDREMNLLLNDELARMNQLHLGIFKYKIAKIYAAFALWKALSEEDEGEITKLKYIWEPLLKIREIAGKVEQKDQITKLKESLALSIPVDGVRMQLIHHDGKFKFAAITDSLINLAYYQLSSLMTRPDTEKRMKNCEHCHSPFWAKGNNSKYCPNCNRKTVWSRNKKEKENE
jgi:hypothetical protein